MPDLTRVGEKEGRYGVAATHGIRVGAIDDDPVTPRGIELLLADFPRSM